jgi:hypothetical protein
MSDTTPSALRLSESAAIEHERIDIDAAATGRVATGFARQRLRCRADMSQAFEAVLPGD